MAKIGTGTLVVWNDGQDVDAVDINRNFEVTRQAINTTSDAADQAASTIDQKVAVVQNDLNTKYASLVQSDEILETSLTQTSALLQKNIDDGDAALLSGYQAADTILRQGLDTKITAQETDSKISAAISTVVAGNAIIPSGTSFPPNGDGRVDGEEFLLISQADQSKALYFYNINIGMWESASKYISILDASTTQKGVIQLTNTNTGTSQTLAPTQKALSDHVNDSVRHVTQANKDAWNAKQTALENVENIELSASRSTNGVSYIDFHTRPGSDYDGRILLGNGNSRMEIIAATDVVVTSQGQTFSLVDLKSSVSSGKTAIASAITDKGISTAADAPFTTMATNIRNISTDPKVVSGDFNTGIMNSDANEVKIFNFTGVIKQPVAYKVFISNTSIINSNGDLRPYTVPLIEFVVDVGSRTVSTSDSSLTITFAVSGNQFSVRTNYTKGTSTNLVRYSLSNWTAVY